MSLSLSPFDASRGPITLSVEDTPFHSYQHPYHLGTDLALARKLAVEEFDRLTRNRELVVTVALVQGAAPRARIVDVWDGREWSSQRA